MSNKKKNHMNNWLRMKKGNLNLFHRPKDVEFFKRVEEAPPHFDVEKELSHAGFPVIINSVLLGEITHQIEKGVTKLPLSAKHDVIQLHPETMSHCGLFIGQPAIVSQTTTLASQDPPKSICTVWPVPNFPASSVGIHPSLQKVHGWDDGGLVKVEAIGGSVAAAASATVLVGSDQDTSVIQSSDFRNFACRYLNSKYIMCGSLFSVTYYGKPVVLEISEITAQTSTEPTNLDQSAMTTQSAERLIKGLERTPSAGSSVADSLTLHLGRTNISNCSFTESRTAEEGQGEADASLGNDGEGKINNSREVMSADTSCSLALSSTRDLEKEFDSLNLSDSRSIVVSSTPKRTPSQSQKQLQENKMDSLSRSQCVTEESGVYRVTKMTRVEVASSEQKEKKNSNEEQLIVKLGGRVTFDMIGGMERQLKAIRDMVMMPLKNPEFFSALGIPPPRGVLLYGPPGVGKTMLARAVACEARVHTVVINGPEVLSKYYGESESRLRALFDEAIQNAPSLILIDELDSLCPRRERVNSELEKRVVSMLLTLMDGMGQNGSSGNHVLVLGATSRPDSIDTALRRPGRFDREIEIGVPNARERRQILEKLTGSLSHCLTPEDITAISDSAHGYVGADLTAVCKEAAMCTFERLQALNEDSLKTSDVASCSVTKEDFLHAMTQIKPSALREVEIDIPKVYWSDIGGQESIKLKLRQAVEWPIKHPEAFTRLGVSPPRGVLLYGPPGCSKTLIAKALATESGLNFISVKGPELFSKWVGDSERAIREVFRKARSAAPAIVFFDEIDGIAVERGSSSGGSNVGDRVLGQLLTELDGVEGLRDVVVVAATNRPDMIDKALMRPGRLDRILYVSLPDDHTREEILNIQFRKMPVADDCSLEMLVKQTKGYSGAEVVAVCREAALAAMQESLDIQSVSQRHFDQALTNVQPQTTQESIRFYEEYQKKSGLHSA